MDKYVIFDIETDGLLYDVSKIHCLSYFKYDSGVTTVGTLTELTQMVDFLKEEDVLIGHNIIRYDIPVLEKLLGIKIQSKLIDTLGLSWYLYPKRVKHGLESWGEDLGVPKPEIKDWKNLTLKDYIHRCTKDVEINTLLWDKQISYLKKIYQDFPIEKIISYISFKLDCAREQEEIGWKIDVRKVLETLHSLIELRDNKEKELANVMPKKQLFKKVSKPKNIFKKDNNLTERGKKWFEILKATGLPLDYEESVKVPIGLELGNPKSSSQLKDWLFSLGWKPATFTYVKDKNTGKERKIPQIYSNMELCDSVEILIANEPNLVHLQGLSIINHRIGILQGFLDCRDNNNFLKAEIHGFTNTMRFKHSKPLVNLPSVHRPYGEDIRGCLISPNEEYVLCGSDMSSLEDNTKQHYMYFYDPDYVREMRVPGFDPHLDIALQGKMLTKEQVEAHKEGREDHSKIRKDAKQINFGAVYGVGPPKLSLTTGWTLKKSTEMLKVYWERNWSVKKVASKTTHKIVDDQMWLWNPVSQFWYSLRYEKDKFSTLNQGTG